MHKNVQFLAKFAAKISIILESAKLLMDFLMKNIVDNILPHPSSPARRFSKITPVPSLPLKSGSTSPSAPSPQERVPTGKPDVLYSQTSSRPKGLLVIIYAIELRLFYAQSASVYAPGRVIMRGGRRGDRRSRSWCR